MNLRNMASDSFPLFRVSVTQLVEVLQRSRGLGGLPSLLESSADLGIETHRRIQESLTPAGTLTSEVPVTWCLDHRSHRFEISGRCDLVLRTQSTEGKTGEAKRSEHLIIYEIKSCASPAAVVHLFEKTLENPHCFQAALYGVLMSESQDISCEAKLIFAATASEQRRVVSLDFGASEVFAKLAEVLDVVLYEQHLESLARRAQRQIARCLMFPYDTSRTTQQKMISQIQEGLNSPQPLFLESPTGSGKTVSVLYPALRDAAARGRTVFFGTAKNSQKFGAIRALRDLNERNTRAPLAGVSLESRERLCLNSSETKICDAKACKYAEDYHLKLRRSRIMPRILERGGVLSATEARALGAHFAVCPFELSLDLARYAQVIVCDYNHIVSPVSRLQRFFGEHQSGENLQLIFDEAHNLAERVCKEHSPELGARKAEGVLQNARVDSAQKRFFARFRKMLESTLETVLGVTDGVAGGQEHVISVDQRVRALFEMLQLNSQAAFAKYSTKKEHLAFDDGVVRLTREVQAFCEAVTTLEFGSESPHSLLVRGSAGELTTKILCKDSSAVLAQFFQKFSTPVFMSATLSPVEYFIRRFGFASPDECTIVLAPSSFPPENRRLFIVPQVTTQYQYRSSQVPKIAGCINRILEIQQRNTFVFFPSFSLCHEVLKHCVFPPGVVLHRQAPSQSPSEVRAQLDAFAGQEGGHVLFGVLRGGLAEGVDLPGDALESVIIVGPALPSVSLEQSLIEQYESSAGRDGFDQAAIIPSMIHVNQAMGRLIRTPRDRGTCFLLDRRFTQVRYFSRLAAEWRGPDPRELISQSLASEIDAFWNGDPVKGKTLV